MSQFKPGEIHNPLGRPKGSGHRQQLFNDLIMPHKTALLDKAIELALNGNEAMLRLFLERMLPTKPIDEPLAGIKPFNGTLSEQGEKALSLITSGQLTPSEGTALIHAISSQAKLIETDDLITRIQNLEENGYAKHQKQDK